MPIRAPLPHEHHLRPLDVHHIFIEPDRPDRLAPLGPRHRAAEITPDEPTARRQGLVLLPAIVRHVLQSCPPSMNAKSSDASRPKSYVVAGYWKMTWSMATTSAAYW